MTSKRSANSRSLHEREKHWEELAVILQKQVAFDRRCAKPAPLLPSWRFLYTEKLQKLDLAIAA